jgi:hypothetical protein
MSGAIMEPKIPEKNKRSGLCYAVTDDGFELPVIDITHPAFTLHLSEMEIDELLNKHLKDVKDQARTPEFLRNIIMGIMQRRSFLMRSIAGSAGTYLSGMNTYIMKLGPDNLNKSYATNIDRMLAASLPVLSMRLRFQDVVRMMANALAQELNTNGPTALHLLNIGGGPAMDSLNTLIVIHKDHPGLLVNRNIFIHILDRDDAGPNFGARALSSLMADNGPLNGLDIHFDHVRYNWSDSTVLLELVKAFDGQDTLVAASSEGGLFEYGSDDEIVANLRTLHEVSSAGALVVGTVTRADEIGLVLNSASRAAINFRGLQAFTKLAELGGWKIKIVLDRPLSHDILMEKA